MRLLSIMSISNQSISNQGKVQSKEQPRSAVTPKYQRWNPFKDTFLLFLLVDFFRCFFLGEDLAKHRSSPLVVQLFVVTAHFKEDKATVGIRFARTSLLQYADPGVGASARERHQRC